MKAIAFCGLACCVCSENKGCVGCQDGGCESHGWCKNYNCCKEKGLNGCWECSEFPCTGYMLDKPRIRAFAKFARRYGVEELEKCLLRNKEKGIVYHYEGQLVGDYDKCQTEEEIIIWCLSPAKKYKLYKSSINKSIHFVQRNLSSRTKKSAW